MKVIKSNNKSSPFPVETHCPNCGAILEVEESDVTPGEYGCPVVTCPVCCEEFFVEELDGEYPDLTVETTHFPQSYAHMSTDEGAVKISNEEIDKNVRKGIDWLRKHPVPDQTNYWYVESGDTRVEVWDLPGDKEYYVTVNPSFYNTFIPYTDEDFRLHDPYEYEPAKTAEDKANYDDPWVKAHPNLAKRLMNDPFSNMHMMQEGNVRYD